MSEWEDDQYERLRLAEERARAREDAAHDAALATESARYVVRRFYADEEHPEHRRVIMRGVTLADARAHCQSPSTHEAGVWFDGYEEDA